MKLVGESSLHNKPTDEKFRIMAELRTKKDIEEKIRVAAQKEEDAEKLEAYYISLKIKEAEKREEREKNATQGSQLRRSFFATHIFDETEIDY